MKTTMARNPELVALKPFAMLSRPRLGPTVRSSMISIGAASEPARSRQRHVVRLGGGHAPGESAPARPESRCGSRAP
jgi:hypothetical protein